MIYMSWPVPFRVHTVFILRNVPVTQGPNTYYVFHILFEKDRETTENATKWVQKNKERRELARVDQESEEDSAY